MDQTRADRADLLALLPHRPPMRLLDEILELDAGRIVRARRRAAPRDWFFQGHFPGEPIVPAIVLIEMVAQAGGLAAASGMASPESVPLRLAAVTGFKFPRAAGPGVMLDVTARVAGRMGPLVKIDGEVTADGSLVAHGSLTLAGTDRTADHR
jgi:3-hydroxyacyl-[acyl-carrier-protein] dehydratase